MSPVGFHIEPALFIKLQGELIHGDSFDNTRQKVIAESMQRHETLDIKDHTLKILNSDSAYRKRKWKRQPTAVA